RRPTAPCPNTTRHGRPVNSNSLIAWLPRFARHHNAAAAAPAHDAPTAGSGELRGLHSTRRSQWIQFAPRTRRRSLAMNVNVLHGHHHLTLCVGSAQEDYNFHADLLGLKSVKKTILYDGKLPIYHLYYGNENGDPSTLITTFSFRHTGLKAERGSGQVRTIACSIPASAVPFWKERLEAHGYTVEELERFGETRLRFYHPCGIEYELVGVENDPRTP